MSKLLGVVVGVVASTLAVPASAAQIDPAKLVLQHSDVPPRYLLEAANSGVLPVGTTTEARREAARIGYVTGYYATYRNTAPPYWRTIRTTAVVFRNDASARAWVASTERESRRRRAAGDRLGRSEVGHGGWVAGTGDSTGVFWRHGRVAAFVSCEKVARHPVVALALARKQQQRIAAALR